MEVEKPTTGCEFYMNETDKSYSDLKIFYHKDKLEDMKNGVISAPLYVRIKPTNRCNHRCYYCSYNDLKLYLRKKVDFTDEIEYKTLASTIDELAEIGVKAITLSGGGEPLVYNKINNIMERVVNHGMDLSIITNGQLVKGKTADILSKSKWVRISLDSHTKELFSDIRRIPEKNFLKLVDNINNFVDIKDKKCELGMNCVVHEKNKDYIYDIAKFSKKLGFNHIKYAARITKDVMEYHKPFKQSVIDQITKAQLELNDKSFRVIDKYSDHFDFSAVYNRTYSKCYIMQIVPIVAADGNVYMCHDKAYVANGLIGNLYKQSFKDIWFSDNTKKLFNSFDAKKECLHHCMYDTRNILLNQYLNMNQEHINFI